MADQDALRVFCLAWVAMRLLVSIAGGVLSLVLMAVIVRLASLVLGWTAAVSIVVLAAGGAWAVYRVNAFVESRRQA